MVKTTTLLCAVAFLALPAVSHAQAATTPAASTPMTAKQKRAEAREERKEGKKEAHPELHAAMASLERAKKDLEKASNDYGGHKAEAIKAVDEAMKHLKLAEAYDKK